MADNDSTNVKKIKPSKKPNQTTNKKNMSEKKKKAERELKSKP